MGNRGCFFNVLLNSRNFSRNSFSNASRYYRYRNVVGRTMIKTCEHVYKYIGADTCPHCGKNTHEIDWNRDREERRLHREKYGLFNQAPNVWWSI